MTAQQPSPDQPERLCIEPGCGKAATSHVSKPARCTAHLNRAWTTGTVPPMAPDVALQRWLEIWAVPDSPTDAA